MGKNTAQATLSTEKDTLTTALADKNAALIEEKAERKIEKAAGDLALKNEKDERKKEKAAGDKALKEKAEAHVALIGDHTTVVSTAINRTKIDLQNKLTNMTEEYAAIKIALTTEEKKNESDQNTGKEYGRDQGVQCVGQCNRSGKK